MNILRTVARGEEDEMWETLMKFVLVTVLLLINVSTGSRCTFSKLWEGEYFHLRYSKSLVVSNDSITEKGECVWNSGSQYVLKSKDGTEDCWRCMSMYMKHQNVLQYKESDCEIRSQMSGPFSDLCTRIAGDGPMHSMFRMNAEPTRCPFKGPFMFSYTKGGTGSPCSFPLSYLDTCRDHARIQMHFQACIDVQGSESNSEELNCIAAWREGSRSYFVGELLSEYMYSEERRYRCFVYEHHGKGTKRTVKMAESAEATCEGLWSPTEGYNYKMFDMERVAVSEDRCTFPVWFSAHHTWTSLDLQTSIHINSGLRSWRLRRMGGATEDAHHHHTCQTLVEQDHGSVKLVNYVKSDCDSGYRCTVISKVSDTVVSVEFGDKCRNPGEACTDMYFYAPTKQLFVSRAHQSTTCPLNGRYTLQPLFNDSVGMLPLTSCAGVGATSLVSAGCGKRGLRVETRCPTNLTRTEFVCHAHWTDSGKSNLILSQRSMDRFLCLSYTESEGSVSVSGCRDQQPMFKLTQSGPCLQALSSVSESSRLQLRSVWLLNLAILIPFFNQCILF